MAVGIGALHLVHDRALFLHVIRGPLLSFYTLLFALAAGEAIIRIAVPSGPMLRTPNEVLEYEPASLGVVGITGRKRLQQTVSACVDRNYRRSRASTGSSLSVAVRPNALLLMTPRNGRIS